MEKRFNSSYKLTLGDLKFQIDIDETLSAEHRAKSFPAYKDKVFHTHPFYELFFVFEDETEIIFEKERKAYKNCIVCLPPSVKHYTLRSNDFRILFSYAPQSESRSAFKSFFTEFFASEAVCQIPISIPSVREYIKELCEIFYGQRNLLDSEVITSILKCILYRIYSLGMTGEAKQEYYAKESRYITIQTLVSKSTYQGSDISLSAIADALCLSKKQTSRLIYKYYGKPLSEVIADEKLNYAAYLLKNTSHSVYDIAYASNFHSYSYFYRSFKEKYGCLPLQYRKNRDAEPITYDTTKFQNKRRDV